MVLKKAGRLRFAKLKIHLGASGVMTALWRSRAIARSVNTDAATWARMFILGVGVAHTCKKRVMLRRRLSKKLRKKCVNRDKSA